MATNKAEKSIKEELKNDLKDLYSLNAKIEKKESKLEELTKKRNELEVKRYGNR